MIPDTIDGISEDHSIFFYKNEIPHIRNNAFYFFSSGLAILLLYIRNRIYLMSLCSFKLRNYNIYAFNAQ